MVSLTQLFWSFFKIGTFTLGGGYAMIPLMEKELVNKHKWITDEEFMESIALAQTMPGIFAVNLATKIGWEKRGLPGAIVSVLGNVVMPIVIILLLAMGLQYVRDNEIVEAVFKALRPVVVALIAAPVFRMIKTAGINKYNFWIPVVAVFLIWLVGISPIWVVLVTIIGAAIYGFAIQKKEVKK